MIKQAIAQWTFGEASSEKWSLDYICQTANRLEVPALEVVNPKDFGSLQNYGLQCALTTSHLFVRGMNNPNHWDECFSLLEHSIEANKNLNFPNVVTFTGFLNTTMEENGSVVSFDEGIKNCVEGYKKIVGKAEKAGVNLCLESLNTRYSEPFHGHPGYQAEHVDTCIEIINKVGSPNLKLLFDAYHIQIMDGDLTGTIKRYKDYIGHVQIAGVPGRGEPDEGQEINYVAVIKALLDTGYEGFIAHEWIPRGNASESLESAVALINNIIVPA